MPARSKFLVGWCAEWAIAYQERNGGRICGFVRKHIEYVEEGLIHAFIVTADGRCIDAAGDHTKEELEAQWLPRGYRSWDYSARLMRLSKACIRRRWGVDAVGLAACRRLLAEPSARTAAISAPR